MYSTFAVDPYVHAPMRTLVSARLLPCKQCILDMCMPAIVCSDRRTVRVKSLCKHTPIFQQFSFDKIKTGRSIFFIFAKMMQNDTLDDILD